MLVRCIACSLIWLACPVCAGAVVYVDIDAPGPSHDGDSWTTAYTSIQQGIDDADAADEQVWVAEGVYHERVTLKHGVHVYGGFHGGETQLSQRDYEGNTCVIDAGGAGRAVTGADNSRLDGFTVTHGSDSYGAGILCFYTSPVIANCIVEDNHTAGYGGGFYIGGSSSVQVINCIIRGNSARDGGGTAVYTHSTPLFQGCTVSANTGNWGAGLLFSDYTNPTVINCRILDNTGGAACFGAGIHLLHNSGVIQDNVIMGNTGARQGGGIYGYDTTALVERNIILDNQASIGGGGLSFRYSSPVVRNNLIVGNTAPSGGGIQSADQSSIECAYNTITGNSAADSGGGIHVSSAGSVHLINCIVSSNTAPDGSGIFVSSGCTFDSSYNDIYDNSVVGMSSPGANCISEDPLFAAPSAGVYHLTAGSACIDAGTVISGVVSDLDGNPRAVDGNNDATAVPDMGCCEFGSGPWRLRLVSQARWLPDGTGVSLSGKPVTAVYDGCFYIQDCDHSAGIKVTGTAVEGAVVDVTGVLGTGDGERVIVQ